jgi:hypothetical protein
MGETFIGESGVPRAQRVSVSLQALPLPNLVDLFRRRNTSLPPSIMPLNELALGVVEDWVHSPMQQECHNRQRRLLWCCLKTGMFSIEYK